MSPRSAKRRAQSIAALTRAGADFAAGMFDRAAGRAQTVARQDPDCAEAHELIALIAAARADRAAAAAAFRRSLALAPAQAGAWRNFALTLAGPAIAARMERAARAAPTDARAWDDVGALRAAAGRYPAAASAHRLALALDPAAARALCNLGVALFPGDAEAAADWYGRAARLAPDQALAWHNLGDAAMRADRVGQAADRFTRAIALSPDLAESWRGAGLAASRLGEAARAIALYHRAATIAADQPAYWGEAAFAALGRPAADAAALNFGRAFPAAAKPAIRARGDGPVTVGLVSPDFRAHVAASFLEPYLDHRDRGRCRVIAYAEVEAPDPIGRRLLAACDAHRLTLGVDDDTVADWVRDDGVDLLVDLAGHTEGNRLGVFARRPAPVQAIWLGYNGTTGLAAIDWRIADPWMLPPGAADPMSERPWRLDRPAHCWRAPFDTPPVAEAPCLRNGFVTFGSFNNLSKLSDETLALWSALLAAVPQARLFLKGRLAHEPRLRDRVAAVMAARGIDPRRWRLEGERPDFAAHLAAYAEMDVALDPVPYNGTTTSCEALWMGVPFIGAAGGRMVGRIGASLLAAVGLDDLIAPDAAGYIARAQRLARDPAALADLRRGLRARMAASPLRDEAGFARTLDGAFRAVALGEAAP